MSFRILGTGHALPKLIITNDELAKMMDTSDEWITSKTGIRERHILSDESLTDISFKAASLALENAGVNPSDIDLIIFSTSYSDNIVPSMACVMAEKFKINCPAFDLNAACTGFIYGLEVAAGFFARKKIKKALLVCGEQVSRFVDWTDRATSVLFGDGAGAVVLGEGNELLSIKLTSTPDRVVLRAPFYKSACPFTKGKDEKPFIVMNGQEVYKFAVSNACKDLKDAVSDAGLNFEKIDYVLLHQANMRITDAIIKLINIPGEKFLTCIDRTGNTSSATIPILLDEANRQNKFKKGDIIALSAFGAGLTNGAAILRWA